MLNQPELTTKALEILRNTDTFQWYFIPLFAFVVYIYFNEVANKNWKGIAAGLSLYMVHWFYEIINALIQHFSGHALAGLIFSKILPADPNLKILGIKNRIVFALANAAFFSVFEIFLVETNAFHWVYPWWGSFPVFVTVYIPFFLAANFAYDWQPARQKKFIGSLFVINAVMLILFAGILKWI